MRVEWRHSTDKQCEVTVTLSSLRRTRSTTTVNAVHATTKLNGAGSIGGYCHFSPQTCAHFLVISYLEFVLIFFLQLQKSSNVLFFGSSSGQRYLVASIVSLSLFFRFFGLALIAPLLLLPRAVRACTLVPQKLDRAIPVSAAILRSWPTCRTRTTSCL